MRIVLFLMVMVSCVRSFAGGPEDSAKLVLEQLKKIDSIESTLHYKTGSVTLKEGMATVKVAPGFRLLEAKEARYVVEDLWGNLQDESTIGLIVPEGTPAVIADYAFIVRFEPMGHVKDADADDINYDDLLKEMQGEETESNNRRTAAGLETMHLVGWASKPFYDKDRKILHWAKEISVERYDENTLNYDIRVLGRKGVLVMQAISNMSMLDTVKKNIDNVLGMVSFNSGHRYEDFDSKTDEVAAWTIGGLVAGKVLAKAGFFALILKNIKLVVIGVGAAATAAWRWFRGRRRKEEEEAPVPEAGPVAENEA